MMGLSRGACGGVGWRGGGGRNFHNVHLHSQAQRTHHLAVIKLKGGCQDRGWEEGRASSWHRMWRWGWSPLAWPLPLQGAQWQLALRGESGWCAWNSSLEPQAPGLGPRTEGLVQAFPRVAWSQVPTLSLTSTTLDLYPGLVPLLGALTRPSGLVGLMLSKLPPTLPFSRLGGGQGERHSPRAAPAPGCSRPAQVFHSQQAGGCQPSLRSGSSAVGLCRAGLTQYPSLGSSPSVSSLELCWWTMEGEGQ